MRVWMGAKLFLGAPQLLAWLRAGLPYPWLGLLAYTVLLGGMAFEVSAYCTLFGVPGWRRDMVALARADHALYAARKGGRDQVASGHAYPRAA